MTLDVWVGLLVLPALFLLEGLRPFDPERPRRWRHGGRNLGIGLVSGLTGAAAAPLLVLAMVWADDQGIGLRHLLGMTLGIFIRSASASAASARTPGSARWRCCGCR